MGALIKKWQLHGGRLNAKGIQTGHGFMFFIISWVVVGPYLNGQ